MKKLFSCLVAIVMLLSLGTGAFAEEPTDYEAQLAEKDAQIAALESRIAELEAQLSGDNAEPEEAPAATYPALQKGSKGEAVQKLQARLKELNYLDGSADGIYGNGTASAVSAFQNAAGIAETGIADEATQIALYADDAPKSLEYVALDYKANARDPEAYKGTLIKFSGKILQVMEDGDYAVFRIATKGNYDDVVYCMYVKPEDYKRFLEDDKVNVWGVSSGIYSYTTIMGGEVTIPSCLISRIELK